MRTAGVGLLLVALMAGAAGAQSGNGAPDTVAARVARFPSPAKATWLSVGLTVLPTVAGGIVAANSSNSSAGSLLFFGGALIGPATGFWYGGIGGKAWPGLLIRTGGMLIAAVGASDCAGSLWGNTSCSGSANAAMVGGGLLVLGSAVYDMATVGRKVSAHNAAMARAMVVPLFSPSRRSVGVEVVIVGF